MCILCLQKNNNNKTAFFLRNGEGGQAGQRAKV